MYQHFLNKLAIQIKPSSITMATHRYLDFDGTLQTIQLAMRGYVDGMK